VTGWREEQQRAAEQAADERARKIAREEVARAITILAEYAGALATVLPFRTIGQGIASALTEAIKRIKEEEQ
jgi:hypothetical protein